MTRRPFALLLAALPVLAGCGHIYLKPPEDGRPPWTPAETVPEEMKACVYVFMFDSFDPVAAGQCGDLRDHIQKMGFGKTYYGWSHHLSEFQVEMGVVQAERPNARFAIIGYGTGATAARKLAAFANTIGIGVDLVIYLEPSEHDATDEPDTATSTFTLRSTDLDAGAVIEHTFVGRHFHKSDVPMHPMTLEMVERELTLLGYSVPPPPRLPGPRVFLVPPMPAPRQTIPIPKELPPEWQFLRPRHPWQPPAPPQPGGNETLPLPEMLPDLPEPKGKA
jgi:hypothetical protein